MEQMKEFIEAVKEKNGNTHHNNKDLLFYLIGKVDKIDSKLDASLAQMNKRIEQNMQFYTTELNKKLDKKGFMMMVGGFFTAIVAVIGGMFKFLYDLIKG